MFLKRFFWNRICNNHGFGLIAAIFVVVILAMFGLLIARFTGTSSIQAAEDYLWSQALYSSQSGIRLRILERDGGGNFGVFTFPIVSQFTLQEIIPPTLHQAPNQPSTIRLSASRGNIVRILEVKYVR